MDQNRTIRRALIAVYDKTGIVDFARALVDEFGIEIISTGGTAKHLKDAGIPVSLVEDVTGFPEMLDGRVKTLHPKIHAAILADRDNPEHMRQLAEHGIEPIDMVVVNLYPFEETVADPNCRFEDAIEMIDIGGPCLLRAAAKNHVHVLVVNAPDSYEFTLSTLRQKTNQKAVVELQRENSSGSFWMTARYDAVVSNWLSQTDKLKTGFFRALHFRNWGPLRYGENPHQTAELLGPYLADEGLDLTRAGAGVDDQADGHLKISFNNYVDADAALALCAELSQAMATTGETTESATSKGRAKLRFAGANDSGDRTPSGPVGIHDEVFTRRKLPHWQRPGAVYWITFTSAIGSLTPEERDITLGALKYWDGSRIELIAAVVMPDHVHAIMSPREIPGATGTFYDLSSLLQSVKAFSGREISKRRRGIGQVWTRESFDRWIRNERDLDEKYRYLADNPVKEGLADSPEKYRWWYGLDVLGVGIGNALDKREETKRRIEGKAELRDSDVEAELRDSDVEAELRPPRFKRFGDLESAGGALRTGESCVVFVKHTNPCGVGIADDPIEAYRRAYLGDPNAAMGGILAVNFPVDRDIAEPVMQTLDRWGKPAGAGAFFIEVWVAPAFDDAAVEVIRTSKMWGRRVRLLTVGDMARSPKAEALRYRSIAGGLLVQTPDQVGLNEDQWKVVTKRKPTESEISDLRLAWLIAKHTRSNAISLVKDGMLIGNGAGQMSRVMSCRIAAWLARENGHADQLPGSAAASDAFFPFRDGPDLLLDAGVTAIIQPGGSKRDAETIAACDERGAAMIFTGTRHFRH